MEKTLHAYLWDDAPAELRALVCTRGTPQMLWVIPPGWLARAKRGGVPMALATLLADYAGPAWGHIERFHQPDGSLLIVGYRAR